MSKERVNIRMDKDIFDFYDKISERENISRSEAMIIGLRYYREKVENENLLKSTLENLDQLESQEITDLTSLISSLDCHKGHRGKNANHHIGRELNTLNLLLNSPRENTESDKPDPIHEDLNKYNNILSSLARPIEILTNNFNYHKLALENTKKYASLIIDALGFQEIKPSQSPCKSKEYNDLKSELKREVLEELKKELK